MKPEVIPSQNHFLKFIIEGNAKYQLEFSKNKDVIFSPTHGPSKKSIHGLQVKNTFSKGDLRGHLVQPPHEETCLAQEHTGHKYSG